MKRRLDRTFRPVSGAKWRAHAANGLPGAAYAHRSAAAIRDYLPAQLDEPVAAAADEDEDDDPCVYLDVYGVPEGFQAVELEEPYDFLGADVVNKGDLWLLLCCDDLTFMLGEIKKFNARATKYNYDIQWEPGPAEKQAIELAAYFADVDATPVAGNWPYLRKTPRRASRARQSDTESDDDDPPRRRARPRA